MELPWLGIFAKASLQSGEALPRLPRLSLCLSLTLDVSDRVGPDFQRGGLRCSPSGGLSMWPSSS